MFTPSPSYTHCTTTTAAIDPYYIEKKADVDNPRFPCPAISPSPSHPTDAHPHAVGTDRTSALHVHMLVGSHYISTCITSAEGCCKPPFAVFNPQTLRTKKKKKNTRETTKQTITGAAANN